MKRPNKESENAAALVRSRSSTPVRTSVDALVKRGLHDLSSISPSDEEYYVIRIHEEWQVITESQVPWEPESLPDGKVFLRTPKSLHRSLFGPFFSKAEAEECIQLKRNPGISASQLESASESIKLPRVIPHLWTGPDDVAAGSPPGCWFCGESDRAQYGKPCPKRTCNTWYEILGVAENADHSEIEAAYCDLINEWNPDRLTTQEDVKYDAGYSHTQIQWFNAAYARLGNPEGRRLYDAELLKQRQSHIGK